MKRVACIGWALVLLAGTTGARAGVQTGGVRIISPQADAVSVTIYRDLFALVTETRTVDLPAGPVTLVFDGVIDTLIPQSAMLSDAGRAVAEGSYDYERLSPASLLRKSIGKSVSLTRTNPATGKVRQVAATLVAANSSGIVFRTDEGNEALHCSGLPEQLTFEAAPADLQSKPRLSIQLGDGPAGRRQLRISYIARGFAWESDYVAKVKDAADTMEIDGWLTLRNFTGSSFRNAQVQVVAGRLNLLDESDGGTSPFGATADFPTDDALERERESALESMLDSYEDDTAEIFSGCYAYGLPQPVSARSNFGFSKKGAPPPAPPYAMEADSLQEVIVTGLKRSMALRENLGDYQLYRLPAPTDLSARQTKQVAFLHKDAVKIERFYSLRVAEDSGRELASNLEDDDIVPANIKIAWLNREKDGLGEPLPGGIVRFFEARDGGAFIGDYKIADSPVGTPMEVMIGQSIDVVVSFDGSMEGEEPGLMALVTRRVKLPVVLRITNGRPFPIPMEIRQGSMTPSPDYRVTGASQRPGRKAGDYQWRFTVPANGEQILTYKVSARVEDY